MVLVRGRGGYMVGWMKIDGRKWIITRVACRTCVSLGKSATPSPRIAMEVSSSDSELRSDATLAGRGEAFIVAALLSPPIRD